MEVSVRELKAHLSEYLRRVRSGEEFIVTAHGRGVARLSKLTRLNEAKKDEARLLDGLSELSWVMPTSKNKPKGLSRGVRLQGAGPSAADMVLEDRE